MPRPFAQFDEQTEGEILEMVRNARSQRVGARRAPKRRHGPRAAATITTVRTGRVSTATAATFAHSGDVLTAYGELEVWETILPAGVADYDTGTSYLVGNYAVESGALYRCKTPTTGAFNAAHWDAVAGSAPELIDRNQATVTVEHRFHTAPPEGALVEWDSQGVRILTCDAPGSWA